MDKAKEQYEIGYLLKPTLKEEDISSFLLKLSDDITKRNGMVISEGKTKKQTLAYPIKKETSAMFNWIKFSLDPIFIREIKDIMDANPVVLRFLIIKTKEEKRKEPSSIKVFSIAKKTAQTEQQIIEKESVQEEEIDKKIEELLGEN
ncbi:30S ribosomal protein S6 [Patescibacteria group bacterium]|nr:30S ribosomal protein S6 [Patescibacteria group bacterium]MBU2633478.1 30S ribosomal protein S6 [Patescibacteria group bacterium]